MGRWFRLAALALVVAIGWVVGEVTKADPTEPASIPAATKPADPSKHLLLSELTVTSLPGQEGSWVELYNPGDQDLDIAGTTLVCNGNIVFSQMDKLIVPGHGLLVVRFGERPERAADMARSFRDNNSATLWAKAGPPSAATQPARKRPPGSCVLFSGKPAPSTAIDCVRWGKKEPDDRHVDMAVEAKVYQPGLPIAIDTPETAGGGGWTFRFDRLVLNRVRFSSPDRGDRWSVIDEAKATPGRGNLLPPPVIYEPGPGERMPALEPFQVIILMQVWPRPEETPIQAGSPASRPDARVPDVRLQIAEDPHFLRVVFDKRMVSGQTVEPAELKGLARCYARVRYDRGTVTTEWSDPVFFIRK